MVIISDRNFCKTIRNNKKPPELSGGVQYYPSLYTWEIEIQLFTLLFQLLTLLSQLLTLLFQLRN